MKHLPTGATAGRAEPERGCPTSSPARGKVCITTAHSSDAAAHVHIACGSFRPDGQCCGGVVTPYLLSAQQQRFVVSVVNSYVSIWR